MSQQRSKRRGYKRVALRMKLKVKRQRKPFLGNKENGPTLVPKQGNLKTNNGKNQVKPTAHPHGLAAAQPTDQPLSHRHSTAVLLADYFQVLSLTPARRSFPRLCPTMKASLLGLVVEGSGK
ncbi:hypothetical protein U1Q18_032779 [Sarracenia purpurea var. burkii]